MVKSKTVDKYGNRKRGGKLEGRVFVLQQQVSLYDIDTRRLEMRKKTLKVKCEELTAMQQEYKHISISIKFITIEYYEELVSKAEILYDEIIKVLNIKNARTKFSDVIKNIYLDIQRLLEQIKTKNPELSKPKCEKTVKEWFYEWLWVYKKEHKAKTTFRCYVSKTKHHIIRVFGDRLLSDVTPREIQVFINDLMKEYKPSTIKQIYLLLQEGYERAVKEKLVDASPVIDIEIPAVVPNTMMSVDIELEKKLIEIFKNDEMCYPFAILIDTGMRTSELCGIKWENVNFKEKKILIRQSYQRVDEYDYINGEIMKTGSCTEETTLKSRTSKREIPMSKGVYNILVQIFNDTIKRKGKIDEKDFVFYNTIGNPIVGDCLRNRLDELLTKHNLKGVSLHRFRHTFATRLYEAKVKLKNIQELLGHSTVQMTERYLHIDKEEQVDSIKALENYCEKLGIAI